MTQEAVIRAARFPEDLAQVQDLCRAYRDYLSSGNARMRHLTQVYYPEAAYARLMSDLPAKYGKPRHAVLLAETAGQPVGCGMYHPITTEDAEIKRLFIAQDGRGRGIGQALSQALVDHIHRDGYRRILLDTNPDFTAARRLYEKLGFQARGPYTDLPKDVAEMLVFYELKL